MSAVPKPRRLTVAEYLAFEERADVRHEFFDGEMFALERSSREHATVTSNLVGELGSRLKGGPCRPFMMDQRVKVERTGLFTYPDLGIVCGPPEYEADDRNSLVNPRVVVEVLSDSTEKYDRTTKFRHYGQLPSVQEYVLVAQDQVSIERFVRQPDGTWNLAVFDDAAGELVFATVPVRMPLTDVYRDVELPADPPLR